MDLSRALQELYAEKQRLEHSIALLEELEQRSVAKSRSRNAVVDGRYESEERLEVSARMRTYWASRRHQNSAPA